jgi:putative endonuclease
MRTREDRKTAEKGGRRAEMLASIWLAVKGYRTLGRRVRTPFGELDIVMAAPDGTICLVEVKARKTAGEAMEAISARQQMRIARAAEYFMRSRPGLSNRPQRFDGVIIFPFGRPRHVKDAWRL